MTVSRHCVILCKTKEKLIKHLKPGHEVTVILDLPHGFHTVTTTAAVLVTANFGNEKLEPRHEDDYQGGDDAVLILKSLDEYNLIKAAIGGECVSSVMGRPRLAETERASQQMQFRVTTLQKESYAKAAAWDRCFSVSEWAKGILDAAAKKACYAA